MNWPRVLAALPFSTTLLAADLNAPLEPARPTIGSEIARGTSAVFDCTISLRGSSWLPISNCGHGVIARNRQANTASEPFLLGVYLETWRNTGSLNRALATSGKPDPSSIESERSWFKLFEDQRLKLGLTDDQVCTAAQRKCEGMKVLFEKARAAP